MKFLIIGDLHIRATNPRYRIDNYYETMLGKLNFIFSLAEKENCEAILQPGDFFDSPDQSNKVEIALINLLNKYSIPVYTVFGQHDTKFRQLFNTTLSVLEAAGVVTILNSDPIRYDSNINIYGASWGEEIPGVIDKNAINILLIHKMIVKDTPLWPGQMDYITAKSALLKYDDYDLIVSGDNHQHFTYGKKFGSLLINCGSLMRTTIAQRDHFPTVYIVGTDTGEAVQHLIPIKPIEEVMNLELADEAKERNEALEVFMKGLTSDYGIELNFEENLKNLMIENETPSHIKKLANNILEKYYEGGK